MAKFKAKKQNIAIDMTPMVDLAFLLITFFMLTVKFRAPEAVEIDLPSSIADTPLPAQDILIISVSADGRVFFGVDSKHTRLSILEKIMKEYKYQFSEKERQIFSVLPEIGVPFEQLKSYLSLSDLERKAMDKRVSIPIDSANNQLKQWILFARYSNPKLRIAIRADERAPYPVIARIIETLKEQKVHRFNLISTLEAQPKT
ncbi:MAG: biopolymer transporter ExbD [Bacteroidia bacterium]|nr:biopolymer transporter ExbD [Bacteroidia bacterium]MCX7764582.1 biopolymer transporter ExbD [Bacteroidia bacterium]MDW8056817.1 biopolymer transporter ExbD [Bacteroidia bacterium]